MKRKICLIIAFIAAVITVVNVAFTVKDEFYYSLDNLPKGKLLRNEINQNVLFSTGTWLEVYEVEPTVEHKAAIRVALRNNNTGENRTIYWQIGTRESLIYWPEEAPDTVIINGVPINLFKGSYDCRDYHGFKYIPKNENEKDNGF